jgi:AraC family transcriptional regulator, positive regulator of tynA and feaB
MTDASAQQWTTDRVPARERVDYWVEAICDAFLEMRSTPRREDKTPGGS